MFEDELNPQLVKVCQQIMAARTAEDIFGDFDTTDQQDQFGQLQELNGQLKNIVNPINYSQPEEKAIASEAAQYLQSLFGQARDRITFGCYGLLPQLPALNRRNQPVIKINRRHEADSREYVIGEPFASGDLSTLYRGDCYISGSYIGQVAIKVANSPEDNDLLANEIRTIKELRLSNSPQCKHLPIIFDQFTAEGNRLGLVMRYFVNYEDLTVIRERNPEGADEQEVAWVLSRLLSVLGRVHSCDITHNNVAPEHIALYLPSHNLALLDFGYATRLPKRNTGEDFLAVNDNFSAPEVLEQGTPSPATDIFSAGLSMIYLLGGDIKARTVPTHVTDGFVRFLETMTMLSQLQREQDAWQLHNQLETLRVKLWGPKQFRPSKL